MHSTLHVGFPGLPTANHSKAQGFTQPAQPYWQRSTEYSSRFSRENWLILANQCSHSIRCTLPLSTLSGPIGFMSLFVLSKTLSVVLPSNLFLLALHHPSFPWANEQVGPPPWPGPSPSCVPMCITSHCHQSLISVPSAFSLCPQHPVGVQGTENEVTREALQLTILFLSIFFPLLLTTQKEFTSI